MNTPASPLLPTYARLPMHFVRGDGCMLYDDAGNEYLDAIAGIAVCALGHCHRDVTAALQDQAATLVHTSNLYEIPHQQELAAKLTTTADMQQAFFCNSGAEANECALKMARLFGHAKNIDTPQVLVLDGAFHGRTIATLSASSGERVRNGYAPYDASFVPVPFNDLGAVGTALQSNPNVVAVLAEPIQGEGGVRIPGAEYLPRLRDLCTRHNTLLILDEIQTGLGRTGAMFAYQHHGIQPDIVTIAKALGNGYPIGACLSGPAVDDLMEAGRHGTTFGGNPLACRAGLTVLDVIERDQLCAHAAHVGQLLLDQLKTHLEPLAGVREVRGAGLMIGIELNSPAGELTQRALQQRLLINVARGHVVRLLPPLILSEAQADTLVQRLVPLIQEIAA